MNSVIVESAGGVARLVGKGKLLRVLGVVFGLAVTIGITIGMGILRTPGEIAGRLPSATLFIGVWLAGGLYALLGANSLSELSAMIPRSGGYYVFARRALGEYVSFVIGWSDWLSTCGTTAILAMVFAEYVGLFLPGLAGQGKAVALAVVVGFALLQWRGIRWGSNTQNITSLLKVIVFAVLIAACFLVGGKGATEAGARLVVPAGLPLLTAFVLSLQAVLYTYDGWASTVYFGEEIVAPGRDIPRSMLGGVVSVIAIYVLVNAALLHVLPWSRLAGEKLAVGAAAETLFGAAGALVLGTLAVVSTLSAVNGNTLCAPRIIYAMSRDGLFSRRAVVVNRGGTPTVTLLVSTIATALFILTGKFDKVLAVLAFFFVTNYTVCFISVFVLRQREPETERPYRAWGYPWTNALALVCSVAFLVGAVWSDTQNSLYSLAILAASYPTFRALKWFARAQTTSV